MKKTIIKLGFTALVIAAAGSCVKLNEVPPGQLAPDNFYKTESDFDAAIVGVYQPLFNGYNAWDFNAPFIMCYGAEDNTTRPQATDSKLFDELKPSSTSSTLTSVWTMCYKSIDNSNAILGQLAGNTLLSGDLINQYSGQAKFLRALNYFYLTRWFGKVPLLTEANQADAATTAESAETDIYAQIEKDLTDAISELPMTFPDKARATQGAAKGLLAKVYLTEAGWPVKDPSKYAQARDMAKSVMTDGTYSLAPVFSDLWLAKNKTTNPEFMFFLTGISTADYVPASHHHVATRPTEEGGWSDRFSEARFLNVFPAGPRKDASFHTTFDDANATQWQNSLYGQPYISKYRDAGAAASFDGPVVSPNGDGFTVLLRYADVLLVYAEAANMAGSGPTADGLEAINMVRRRANAKDISSPDATVDLPAGLSQSAFDDSVLAERNWELAFEANRWFDLVRKEKVVEVNKALYPYVDAHNMLLPKPATEVALLTGFLNQNTGY